MLSECDIRVRVSLCVCAQTTEYPEPHTVYTPVETISDSLPDTHRRHSLKETQAKKQKCREKRREGGWRGLRVDKIKRRRMRQSVTHWHAHIQTHTHTDGKINEQIFWQRYITLRAREKEHQGKRQYLSSPWPTGDGLSSSAIWCNSPETVSILHIKRNHTSVIKPTRHALWNQSRLCVASRWIVRIIWQSPVHVNL